MKNTFKPLSILIFMQLSFNSLTAQDDFRVLPYLQNPGPNAMTIIWFSEQQTSGICSYRRLNTEMKTSITSNPVPAEALAYSVWEDTTYFEGEAASVPYRHRVRIEDLDPNATYEYSVAQGSGFFNSSFRTAPEGNAPVRFIIYADSETEPESTGSFSLWIDPLTLVWRSYLFDQTTGYGNNLDVIRSRHPDLVFIAGDLVQSGGEQRDWDEFWRHNTDQDSEKSLAGSIPIQAALGNHDYYEGPYLGQYNQPGSERAVNRFLTYFETASNHAPNAEQEGRYYSLKYGPATFIVLDVCNQSPNASDEDTNFYLLGENDTGGGNAPDFAPGSQQYQWLEAQLIEAQLNSLFTFVIFHHAPYSSGPHGLAPGIVESTDNQSGIPVRQLTPVFFRYGVDAVFSGHDEMWERSEVAGSETRSDGTEEGYTIHFYDVGIGGDGLREPFKGTDNPFQEFLVHTDVPEVWENGILKDGGKHYGHLEVDIMPQDDSTWQAILNPVYIFPLYNPGDSSYSDFERRVYDDQIILTRNENHTRVSTNAIDVSNHLPGSLLYSRNHPNPFHTNTMIEYNLPEQCVVTFKIFNLQGKNIRLLDAGLQLNGFNNIVWDGKDESGNLVSPGPYYYRFETSSGQVISGQMIKERNK